MKPITKRVKKVLDECFDGSVSGMAYAVGVDRTTCSRYKNGDVVPNRRTLIILGQATGVSLGWLENGPGDEIVWEEKSSSAAAEDLKLPVLRAPVEELPKQDDPSHASMSFAPPPDFYNADRYWLWISNPIEAKGVQIGDFVLIERCEPRQVKSEDMDKLCALKRSGKHLLVVVADEDLRKRRDKPLIIGEAKILHRQF